MTQDADAAPIKSDAFEGVGLLIIDMINPFDFAGADKLLPKMDRVAEATLKLRAQADALGVPTLYVNDNYGHWRSDSSRIVAACTAPEAPGRRIVEQIAPRKRDYFVIKPHVSGFYGTTLPVLLPRLGVNRLVLTGVAADICVLFTAADAHMREYALWVPQDAVAGEDDQREAWSLATLSKAFGADCSPTTQCTLRAWSERGKS
ncbi:cysteine hydrolase [Caulobacter segnis]|uniref:cysteine hydrolase family protein n=1 Tax=Caulobacter segnis TaxID=88688 RepID=UPI00240FEE62|nr:isochorismatase family cysteine hydrolase [Caulobacter segnis]MDG2520474.1 cysteine hydrolase [Caulobacter segnis]